MTDVMTAKEAGIYLRLSEHAVKRLARADRLPAAKVGRVWRFRKLELDEWLARGGTLQEQSRQASLGL